MIWKMFVNLKTELTAMFYVYSNQIARFLI